MARRRLLSIGLLITAVLVGVGAFAGCGSGNGRGEKVMDMNGLAPHWGSFGLAASGNGTVALAWIDGSGHLKLSELKPGTWRWSKPEVIASIDLNNWPATVEPVPVAYDGSERLLVAWAIGRETHGHSYIAVMARIREADGKWEPARTLNRGQADGINVSSGKRSFALSWHNTSAGMSQDINQPPWYPNVSGFRILRGKRWLPSVHVGAEGEPVEVQLLGSGYPKALWILPVESKLMDASILPNGRLGKAKVLSKASGCLVSSFDSSEIVAGWYYKGEPLASVWSGKRWTKPKKVGQSSTGACEGSIGAAISRRQAAVVLGWEYALWRKGKWTRTYSLPPTDLPSTGWGAKGGWGVNAASLHSGDIFLAGFGGVLQIVHVRPSGERTSRHYPINQGGHIESVQTSASSAKTVALAWMSDIGGFGDNPDEHLFVWVYRP